MRVFISWSGERGRQLAEALRTWLPDVINAIEPWVSSTDVRPGSRWNAEVAKALDATTVGLLCLTPEAAASPWVLFEAGALAKSVQNRETSVIPFLLPGMSVGALSGPLQQFQTVRSDDRDSVLKMMLNLNALLANAGTSPLDVERLKRVFDRFWPDLEARVASVAAEQPTPAQREADESGLAGMVYIPRATHPVGTSEARLEVLLRDHPGIWEKYFLAEYPQHECTSGGLWIDRHQVSNAEYLRFVLATGYKSACAEFLAHIPEHIRGGREPLPLAIANHPVTYVTFEDASQYAKWLGKRLPTEIEWELAARGIDAREFPWGNTWEPNRCNSEEAARNGTVAVGSFELGKSVYGCYDMAGNAWDWTESWYDACPGARADYHNAKDMGTRNKVLRGGSYAWPRFDQRCAFRALKEPVKALPEIGFRCVRGEI